MPSPSDQLRQTLLQLSTPAKRLMGLALDVVLIPAALWLAFFLRLWPDQRINPLEYYWLFLAALVTAIPIFIRLGLYRAVLRYMGRDAVTTILKATALAALLLALVIYWARSDLLIPRTIVFIYWIALFALIGGSRYLARAFLLPNSRNGAISSMFRMSRRTDPRRRVAIYGAGSAGFQLYRSIQHDTDLRPVAFIDDDPHLRGRRVESLRVYSREQIPRLIAQTGTSDVFLAIPSLEPSGRKEILQYLEQFPLHVRTVPSVHELTTGRRILSELEEVRVEDILGREVVAPDPELLERCITGKAVMVTGAGGSIGSELCRQILDLRPTCLVLFDHSEFNLFTIEEELTGEIERKGLDAELYGILGSVLNSDQVRATIDSFGVQTIYHAAAYKHVPIVERNIAAGIRNNVFGTARTAQAALESGVQNFVLISTDKAVRPTNIMGASKRLAELILQALSKKDADGPDGSVGRVGPPVTRFTIVRFGNVLDSSGSVIPKFRQQIRSGGPVTVTDPDVIRYFMTISEAAQLVIQASSMGTGGDVFLLNMGEPIKILDLAEKMIRLSGLSPGREGDPNADIEITFTGLRPGEKLYEELLIDGRAFPTGHPRIMRALEQERSWPEVTRTLDDIQVALENTDLVAVRNILEECIDGFEPQELMDWTVRPGEKAPSTAKIVRLS